MYSVIATASLSGISSMMVQVEADVCTGMPSFDMVGFLSSEVKEARERIRSAIRNSGFDLAPKKITVNLCPADQRKSGTGFDLPMALAVLGAYGIVDTTELERTLFLGEIDLKGNLHPIKGVLPMVLEAKEQGFEQVLLPRENAPEAAFVSGIRILSADNLSLVIDFLNKKEGILPFVRAKETQAENRPAVDFSQINGQPLLRRACLVAAGGMHNLFMSGPPGSGKSMAAKALPGILPNLTEREKMELAKIYSVSGLFSERRETLDLRPFRSPHHSVTRTALVGGGRTPQPGEITLAHKGILFLDELTEYAKPILEQLRQPLEDKRVNLVRLNGTVVYPADFMLVGAANLCPCGNYPNRNKCTCSISAIRHHMQKLSKPLLDRMDLFVEVPRVKMEELLQQKENESSLEMRRKVERVHLLQQKRYQGEDFDYNSRIPPKKMEVYCPMDEEAGEEIARAYQTYDLSARAYHRMIRVARTVADLADSPIITGEHMREAMLYRSAGEQLWRAGHEL